MSLTQTTGSGELPRVDLAVEAERRTQLGSGPEALHTVEHVLAAVGALATLASVTLAWLLAKPGVTAPIIGASKPGHFDEAVAALDIALTGDEVAALEAAYLPHAVVGF